MTTTTRQATIVPSSSPSRPRLVLAPIRAGQAVLDGGWWPRSWDPVAELPGLVVALSDLYGPIRQVMLNSGAWGGRFRRLAVGTQLVRMGWFTSLDPALAIATTERGDQLDLLVVPPQTSEAVARGAMADAADPINTMRAPDVLAAAAAAAGAAAAAAAAPVPAPEGDANPTSVWDNEGGHFLDTPARIRRPVAIST